LLIFKENLFYIIIYFIQVLQMCV